MFKGPDFILRAMETPWQVRLGFCKNLWLLCRWIGRGGEQDSTKMVVAGPRVVAAGTEERDRLEGHLGGKESTWELIRFKSEDISIYHRFRCG